jgi:hypothetical protein
LSFSSFPFLVELKVFDWTVGFDLGFAKKIFISLHQSDWTFEFSVCIEHCPSYLKIPDASHACRGLFLYAPKARSILHAWIRG